MDGWCYKSANNVVLEFLRDETLNINQMEFVKLIVNYIIDNRIMDMTMFERYRVNKFGSA
ncbi:hypothetical protein [Marinisporobacter balticus]|uniref:hypothetical protein n=1 Tax=Marinisporobacter balticus TaxID=2018667 RepID=UPI001047432C|nr:hypothetical protein [Marinisporobacter balticus]